MSVPILQQSTFGFRSVHGPVMLMWLQITRFSWISPFWEEVVEAFIPTLVITLLAGFFLNWILGQILLAFAVFMVNPSEGLLLTAHVYRNIFTPDVRPIGRCLEPIVVFVLHILPNRLVEVNTFFLRWQYVLKGG